MRQSKDRLFSFLSAVCSCASFTHSMLSLDGGIAGWITFMLISALYASISIYLASALRLTRKMRLVAAIDESLITEYKRYLGYTLAINIVATEIIQRDMEELWMAIGQGVTGLCQRNDL